MGCAASKESGGAKRRSGQSPPVAPEPSESERRPEELLSTATSARTMFHTETTEDLSFYGFRGGGRSSTSLGESNPRSEGGSEISLFSTSSKRSTGFGGFGGEKLSEGSEEEEFDVDFEDEDSQPTHLSRVRRRGAEAAGTTVAASPVGPRIPSAGASNAAATVAAAAGAAGAAIAGASAGAGAAKSGARGVGLAPLAAGIPPDRQLSSHRRAPAYGTRHGSNASPEGEGRGMPPSPSSVEEATGAKVPVSASLAAEALAEAPAPSVQVLSSRESTSSDRRRRVDMVLGAKAEAGAGGTAWQPSPSTPRTEEASPAGASAGQAATPVRTMVLRQHGPVGPFAFPPEAPMLLLPLAGLSAAGCIPSYQAAFASGALVPYDALDRNSTFVVFVSHRWLDESPSSSEASGSSDDGSPLGRQQQQRPWGSAARASPDVNSAKHTILVEGLNSLLASLPREVAVFLWIDFSCVDLENEDSKRRGARSVAAYMQLSDAVFTPYAEDLYPRSTSSGGGKGDGDGDGDGEQEARSGAVWWGAQAGVAGSSSGHRRRASGWGPGGGGQERDAAFANPLGEVCSTSWPNSYKSLQDFCSRAWCRLELLLCAGLPLRDGGFRYFAARGDGARAQDRPHFLYGEYQRCRRLPPETLARSVDEAWAQALDPLEGDLNDANDMEAIVHGMGPLRLASRFVPAGSSFMASSPTPPPSLPHGVLHDRRRPGMPSPVEAAWSRSPSDRGSDVGAGRGRDRRALGREEMAVAVVPAARGRGKGAGRGAIPPPIETRVVPNLTDDSDLASGRRSDAPDRLMSPAVKGSRIMASPMKTRTAAFDSALVAGASSAMEDSKTPSWLWDSVFGYPLGEGHTRTQYSDGSTYVGPLRGGMRHGKGAYFFQDGSRYEGGFKEDKRHGEGTLSLAGGGRYVGEWQDDLQHGQGTFYFADSSCFRGLWLQGKKKSGVFTYSSGGRYIGELQGGRRHGRGSFLYPDGSSYEGQWQDNVKHGEGTAFYASGNRYVGQWRNGKSHGEGTYFYATGARYEGQFDGGKCHGRGTYYYANGNRYEGEWKDDMKWGFGKAVYRKKAHYEGHFFMDKRHGFGRMWYANAGTYEGEWASGKPHGQGTATHKDGEKYVGTYKAGLYHGEGCYWYTNGAVYEGEYRNGRVHGKGRATFPSGDSYAGEWKEGAMSGTGVYEFKAEGASYEGDFRNGRMHGVGVYRWPHGDVYRGSWEADRRSGRGRYEWTELGLTFEGTFRDDRRTGRGSIIFPDNSRYECQWEDDRAMDSTAETARSIHYRFDGTECSGDCDVRCKEKGGDELRRLMRRINEQRMMQPVTPTVQHESEDQAQQRTTTLAPQAPSATESVSDT